MVKHFQNQNGSPYQCKKQHVQIKELQNPLILNNHDKKLTLFITLTQMPYNVERILLMASGMDTTKVQKIMSDFENSPNGTVIPADILTAIQSIVVGKLNL